MARTPKVSEISDAQLQEAQGAPALMANDVSELRALVQDLSSQVKDLKNPRSTATIRKRTKEKVASMREYAVDGEVKGLVLKIWDVKEVKDKTEAKRFHGICKLEVFNPITNEVEVVKEVDYLDFLNNAHPVPCKFLRWEQKKRSEVEKKHGGGGIGKLYKQTSTGEYIAAEEFEFEVEYVDHKFLVEVLEGAFEGAQFETNGSGFNL